MAKRHVSSLDLCGPSSAPPHDFSFFVQTSTVRTEPSKTEPFSIEIAACASSGVVYAAPPMPLAAETYLQLPACFMCSWSLTRSNGSGTPPSQTFFSIAKSRRPPPFLPLPQPLPQPQSHIG